jgi:hypothetical protein
MRCAHGENHASLGIKRMTGLMVMSFSLSGGINIIYNIPAISLYAHRMKNREAGAVRMAAVEP